MSKLLHSLLKLKDYFVIGAFIRKRNTSIFLCHCCHILMMKEKTCVTKLFLYTDVRCQWQNCYFGPT